MTTRLVIISDYKGKSELKLKKGYVKICYRNNK